MAEHLDTRIDEENTKDAQYPLEALHHRRTCKDEDATQYQGTEDAPEKYFVLVFRLDTEEGEEHEEHEEVVHRQRLLNDIASQELHRLLMRLHGIPQKDAKTKYQRHTDPNGGHLQCFGYTDLVLAFLAERLQVDEQHDEDQHIKQDPRPHGHTDYFHIRVQRYMILIRK